MNAVDRIVGLQIGDHVRLVVDDVCLKYINRRNSLTWTRSTKLTIVAWYETYKGERMPVVRARTAKLGLPINYVEPWT